MLCLSEGLIISSGATGLVRTSARVVARDWSAMGMLTLTGAQGQNINLVFEIAVRWIVSLHAIYTATLRMHVSSRLGSDMSGMNQQNGRSMLG